MPRYFFDVLHEGDRISRDHEGIDLPDMVAAEIEAMEIWKRLIRTHRSGGEDPLTWHVLVLDTDGTLLAKVPFPHDLSWDEEEEATSPADAERSREPAGLPHGA